MGNCLKKESAVEWGGEEWEFLSSKPRKSTAAAAPFSSSSSEADSKRRENKCKKVRFNAHVEVLGGDYEGEQLKEEEEEKKEGMEQVRIRITKKQLEDLLGKVEVQSLSVHEMMSCLITEIHLSSSEPQEDDHGRRAPVLKTIQEL
ncbi:hypothetical protein QQ045_007159 [Rhodiola kirilowii]